MFLSTYRCMAIHETLKQDEESLADNNAFSIHDLHGRNEFVTWSCRAYAVTPRSRTRCPLINIIVSHYGVRRSTHVGCAQGCNSWLVSWPRANTNLRFQHGILQVSSAKRPIIRTIRSPAIGYTLSLLRFVRFLVRSTSTTTTTTTPGDDFPRMFVSTAGWCALARYLEWRSPRFSWNRSLNSP